MRANHSTSLTFPGPEGARRTPQHDNSRLGTGEGLGSHPCPCLTPRPAGLQEARSGQASKLYERAEAWVGLTQTKHGFIPALTKGLAKRKSQDPGMGFPGPTGLSRKLAQAQLAEQTAPFSGKGWERPSPGEAQGWGI